MSHPPFPLSPAKRPTLSLIGVGAFGAFCIPHLRDHFALKLCDPQRDLDDLCRQHGIEAVELSEAAAQDIVVLAVPFRQIRAVAQAIAPHLNAGALVIDVCSIKVTPLSILEEELPHHVDIVGTHPLFGPQSGKNGIAGLRIAVCAARGRKAPLVARFLGKELRLAVARTSAEEHDRQMAYVQGLTHLLARITVAMEMPPLDHTTTTFSHLESMVGMVRHDSDELFRTIMQENPFADDMVRTFVRAANDVLQPLSYPANGNALS